ncbi:hypothetical protein FACS1894113_5430 [Alphaproteobacteria bacterium]|nr:hypothetical protein FACS1894113_5430 [Alphaproteobacteria bacterium]
MNFKNILKNLIIAGTVANISSQAANATQVTDTKLVYPIGKENYYFIEGFVNKTNIGKFPADAEIVQSYDTNFAKEVSKVLKRSLFFRIDSVIFAKAASKFAADHCCCLRKDLKIKGLYGCSGSKIQYIALVPASNGSVPFMSTAHNLLFNATNAIVNGKASVCLSSEGSQNTLTIYFRTGLHGINLDKIGSVLPIYGIRIVGKGVKITPARIKKIKEKIASLRMKLKNKTSVTTYKIESKRNKKSTLVKQVNALQNEILILVNQLFMEFSDCYPVFGLSTPKERIL